MNEVLEKVKAFIANMTKQQKIIAIAVAAVLVLAIIIGIVALAIGGSSNQPSGDKQEYTVSITTEGGIPMEKVQVSVYTDATKADLVDVGKTDKDGKFSFQAAASNDYVAVLENVPTGYPVEESYKFTDGKLTLALKASLLSVDEVLKAESQIFRLGSVFADMSVTVDGQTYTISELLKTKKAVVINFWYETCDPCKAEFPFMNEAYAAYSSDIEILAVNPYDGDENSVAAYKQENGIGFPMAKIDEKWAVAMGLQAYPTTVVIDRYGTVAFMHTGSVPSTDSFNQLFGYFTAEDYKQTTIRNLDDIVQKTEGGEGTPESPYEKYELEYEIEVAAGKEVYIQMYKVNDMLLEVAGEDAYILFDDEKYEAKDGKASVLLTCSDVNTPAVFAIGNKGSEAKTFQVKLSFPEGEFGNPITMNLGAVKVDMPAGKETGLYYIYTATANGDFTLTCDSVTDGVEYDVSLYNLTSYAMRMLSENEAEDANAVSIAVNAGDQVQVMITTLPDDKGEYPEAQFGFTASFQAGEGTGIDPNAQIEYKVNVKDNKGNAVAGATVTFKDNSGATKTATTDADGVASIKMKRADYTFTVSAPSGYKSDDTIYVADATAVVSIVLQKSTVQVPKKTYTITVKDESGKSIVGANVSLGESLVKTDANGMASFSLDEGSYTAQISASGYVTGNANVTVGTPSATVTLKKEVVEVKKTTYTITVKDDAGRVKSGVTVQFFQGAMIVEAGNTGSNGKVSVTLPDGNYTAKVSSSSLGSGEVNLTVSGNSAELVVAEKKEGVYKDLCGNNSMEVHLGVNYVTVPDGVNYFFFDPTKSGEYEVTIAGAMNGQVAYAGAYAEFYLATPSDGAYGDKVTTKITDAELNVDEESGQVKPKIIFTVRGTSETVVIIKRVGDAIDTTITYTPFAGTHTPNASFNKVPSTGTQKWVDITGSFTIVKGSDGYYHKDTVNGPIVFVHVGHSVASGGSGQSCCTVTATEKNKFDFAEAIHGNGFRSNDLKQDYWDLMHAYTKASDAKYGVYPLTDDLMHMIKNCNWAANDWFTEHSALFASEVKAGKINEAIQWMFECCYWE